VSFIIEVSRQLGRLPWVVGFSGGKDSTITVHVVVEAIKRGAELSNVYVIYEDTLLEHPSLRRSAVEMLRSLQKISQEELRSIVKPIILKPMVSKDFISMMVLKGYPAPGPRFRWCTRVLKLEPLKNFICPLREFVMVSGVRLSESNYRKGNIKSKRLQGKTITEMSFAGTKAIVVMPILTWSNSDVITFLSTMNRWDGENYNYILELYGLNNAYEKILTEIPITIRFGCWICTVISREKMPIPKQLLEVKRKLLYITKRDPKYRERIGERLGKLNIEGRKAVARIFLQTLQETPEAFSYNVKNLEKCLKTIINNYDETKTACINLY